MCIRDSLEAVSPISKTAHGGYCAQSNEKDEAYTRKAHKKGLVSEGERLACADLKACFSCEHQVLVESVDDIWALLSFKECVEESLYLHESTSHFVKNYGDLLAQIENRVGKLSRGVVKRAQTKLADEGRHPLWLDASDLGSVV